MFLHDVIPTSVLLNKNINVHDCSIDIITLKKLPVVRFVVSKFWNLLCYFRFDKSKWPWEHPGDRHASTESKGEGHGRGEPDVTPGVQHCPVQSKQHRQCVSFRRRPGTGSGGNPQKTLQAKETPKKNHWIHRAWDWEGL